MTQISSGVKLYFSGHNGNISTVVGKFRSHDCFTLKNRVHKNALLFSAGHHSHNWV